MNSFICGNCHKEVTTGGNIGTHQRNHCPYCLYSKHVDNTPGDRQASCHGLMQPIGLTFKQEGKEKAGELMLVHLCQKCGKISINRVAGDDDANEIMNVFEDSLHMSEQTKDRLKMQKIDIASEKNEKEIKIQLFGN